MKEDFDSSLARRQQKVRLGCIYYYLYLSVFIWWQKSGVSFRCAKCLKAKANRKKNENCFHYAIKKNKHAPVVRRMPWPWMFRIVTGLFPSQQLLSVEVAEKPVTGERWFAVSQRPGLENDPVACRVLGGQLLHGRNRLFSIFFKIFMFQTWISHEHETCLYYAWVI